MSGSAGGSASRWGPLFGARAAAWAETWEGPAGWGTPVYEYVLGRAESVSAYECSTAAAARGASLAWHPIGERALQGSTLG